MAILKMKKLRLCGIAEEQTQLIRELQLLGSVEIGSPEALTGAQQTQIFRAGDSSSADALSRTSAALASALETLKQYETKKGGLFSARPEKRVSPPSSTRIHWPHPGQSPSFSPVSPGHTSCTSSSLPAPSRFLSTAARVHKAVMSRSSSQMFTAATAPFLRGAHGDRRCRCAERCPATGSRPRNTAGRSSRDPPPPR